MTRTLQKIGQDNFQECCFLPTFKREDVDFKPHDEPKWHLQVFNSNGMKDWDVAELKLKKRSITDEDVARFSDRKNLIEEKREWIEEHVSRRIQLFFQQSILCYNTPFVYQSEGAEDQIGIGSSVKLNANLTHKTQAAHSSTMPCLYACPKDESGKIDLNKRFVFLKYAHSYNQHNATIELPEEVNKADCLIDGTAQQEKLRASALGIINRVAEAKIDPTKATKQFLKAFEGRLIQLRDELSEDDLRREVVLIYLSHVQEVIEGIADSPLIFDQILGVNLPEPEKILRDVVYKRRYELIQRAEFIESQIAKRIFQAQKEMFGRKAASFKSVDYRLRYALLEGATTERERTFYEKFFCTSLEQLRTNIANKQQKLRTVENAAHRIEKDKKPEIVSLRRDLRVFLRDLQKLEFEFRSKLFKGLRVEYKDWYQREFVSAFKNDHPGEPMSQAMVSRLEQPSRLRPADGFYRTPESQRKKEIDIAKAQKISSTFGIDVGLFLPGLISSG